MKTKALTLACILSLLALTAAAQTEDIQKGQNAGPEKVLRVGFEKTKPLNNLDRYGSKATYDIESYSRVIPVYNTSILSRTAAKAAFNASQRLGSVSKFSFNTDIYKPIYNVSQFSRVKPLYDLAAVSRQRPAYSISGYPAIKAVNSIP